MKRISGVLITFNEEEKVGRALTTLKGLVDEIIVVDSCSTDSTEAICREHTDRFIRKPWEGYRLQKQFATDQAQYEWILSLDADEALSPELREEISRWKTDDAESHFSGYLLPRKTFFMGRWIEHTTWYPDWQLRLFRQDAGTWRGGRIHESVVVNGAVGRFAGVIEHYTYTSVAEYLGQLQRFSSLAAEDAFEQGRKAGWHHLVLNPPAAFLTNYFIRLGLLDGLPGLVVSLLAAISVFFKYLKLWELHHSSPTREPSS